MLFGMIDTYAMELDFSFAAHRQNVRDKYSVY
jgi:hypothetical protein